MHSYEDHNDELNDIARRLAELERERRQLIRREVDVLRHLRTVEHEGEA